MLLSRHPVPSVVCASVTAPTWSTAVQHSYSTDLAATTLLTKLALDPNSVPHFTLNSRLLRSRNHIWIGNDSALQQRLISEFHASTWVGHSGVPVTHMSLKQCFAWKGMKSVVKEFVQSCSICQKSKNDRSKSPGLLQPLPVPDSVW